MEKAKIGQEHELIEMVRWMKRDGSVLLIPCREPVWVSSDVGGGQALGWRSSSLSALLAVTHDSGQVRNHFAVWNLHLA